MNIIGKWKLSSINAPGDTAELFEENKDMLLEFLCDGTLNTIVLAVEPYISMAAEAGDEAREDGYIVLYSSRWEERDGDIYYDSEVEGEILDEAITDSMVKLGITDDDHILYNYETFCYERV